MKFLKFILIVLLIPIQQVYADSTNDCFSAIAQDSELFLIKDKVSLSGTQNQTFAMLADETIPTADEKLVIFKWATEREQCLKKYPPPNKPFTQINMEGFNSVQSLILDLYKGHITYGKFTSQRQEVGKMIDAKSQEISRQYQQQQGQQQQRQYEQQQQQQQQEYQRQRENQQFCEAKLQQCLNRAGDINARNACNMENGGCNIGRLIGDSLNK